MVLGIFDYYASSGSDGDVYTIGLNEFNGMLMECELPVPGSSDCCKQHLEQVFIAVDSGQKVKEKFNVKHALSRQEFLQILVRTAVLRYIKPRKAGESPVHTDVSEAVRELVLNQMKPRVGPGALQISNDFRQNFLYVQETDATLANYEDTLRSLYEVYSDETHATHDLASISGMMGFNEWLNLCTHMQLIDEEFTIREMTNCFMWSRMRVADETNIAERRKMCNLRFEDFLEALCRMATMKCMPTDDEVAQCGCSDGGHMLLSMNPAERRKFAIQRPQTWDGPMRQPIGRAMNHLITYMIRIIEDTVSVLWKAPQEGDLKLSRKEVQAFKKIGGLAGADSGSPGP